jgi:hypothetical protein
MLDRRQRLVATNRLRGLPVEPVADLPDGLQVASARRIDKLVRNLAQGFVVLTSRCYLHAQGIAEGLIALLSA